MLKWRVLIDIKNKGVPYFDARYTRQVASRWDMSHLPVVTGKEEEFIQSCLQVFIWKIMLKKSKTSSASTISVFWKSAWNLGKSLNPRVFIGLLNCKSSYWISTKLVFTSGMENLNQPFLNFGVGKIRAYIYVTT